MTAPPRPGKNNASASHNPRTEAANNLAPREGDKKHRRRRQRRRRARQNDTNSDHIFSQEVEAPSGLESLGTMGLTLRPEQAALLRQPQGPYVATCTLMRNSPQLLAESTFLNIRRAMLQLTRWAYAEKRDPWEEGTVARW